MQHTLIHATTKQGTHAPGALGLDSTPVTDSFPASIRHALTISRPPTVHYTRTHILYQPPKSSTHTQLLTCTSLLVAPEVLLALTGPAHALAELATPTMAAVPDPTSAPAAAAAPVPVPNTAAASSLAENGPGAELAAVAAPAPVSSHTPPTAAGSPAAALTAAASRALGVKPGVLQCRELHVECGVLQAELPVLSGPNSSSHRFLCHLQDT